MIFGGLRLSLSHFGRQAPESPVSQLQNGVSTSFVPPFIVDILTGPTGFFSMETLEGYPTSGLQLAETAVLHNLTFLHYGFAQNLIVS